MKRCAEVMTTVNADVILMDIEGTTTSIEFVKVCTVFLIFLI